MGLLTREAILQADDLPKQLVAVPEWGGEVWVRALSGEERDAFEASCIEQRGKSLESNFDNTRAKLCAKTICDENGKQLFSEADIDSLGKKSGSALDRIFAAARKISRLSKEDIEELAKN